MQQAPYKAPSQSKENEKISEPKIKEKAKNPAIATPMMRQFLEIKAVNPGYLLFYRMGDFYELFFEDAEIASRALGIVLTKRGKHLENDIPMCGVPVHSADNYLKKLIALGHKVAICEQLEDPLEAKKRGSKAVVKRDVVRLVSAGTITEDELLPSKSNNFLCSISHIKHEKDEFALAFADISTGESFYIQLGAKKLANEIALIEPSEIIITQKTLNYILDNNFAEKNISKICTIIDEDKFDSELAKQNLSLAFDNIDINSLTRPVISALGALIDYLWQTQKNNNISLRIPSAKNNNGIMEIDIASSNSLEIITTNQGAHKGSLLSIIDYCKTPAGSRLLVRRLLAPLTDVKEINYRLDMVEYLYLDNILRQTLRQNIRLLPDISRALTRLALDRSGPRDLANLGEAIKKGLELKNIIAQKDNLPKGLQKIIAILSRLPKELGEKISKAFIDEAPIKKSDGGFIRENFDKELDKQRQLASQSRTIISTLQQQLSQESEIKNLKIKHNRVLGYFIEVPALQGKKLLDNEHNGKFIHRQTMANAMRFTTSELARLESEIALSQAKALEIELEIFAKLRSELLAQTKNLQQSADALSELDLTLGLAELAALKNYSRPKIDDSLAFNIKGGRHPVVEQTLSDNNEDFITNDCDLSGSGKEGGQLWLITGPNMGGKSTFLRQNALIAILAQIGSFVPAQSAHIGVVDKLFSRVGASDDIAKGRSTFMVEMVETAAILNGATMRSLVILDEIGRGTSTFDGLSIAWASAEALNKVNRSRALFATHFHELTSLIKTLDRASNHTMKVKEYGGDLVFLHQVIKGAADRSYGIQVAKLAGLPKHVLNRARQVLDLLEQQPTNSSAIFDDLPLFNVKINEEKKNISDPVKELLDEIKPDELTPLKAIELLYELKKLNDGK